MDRSISHNNHHFHNLNDVTNQLPNDAANIMDDIRLVDNAAASCRLVKVHRPLPLHFHSSSDENVYVFRGRAIFLLANERKEIAEGMFVQFTKGTPHAILEIVEHPFITLTVDTPRRPESDVTFINTQVKL